MNIVVPTKGKESYGVQLGEALNNTQLVLVAEEQAKYAQEVISKNIFDETFVYLCDGHGFFNGFFVKQDGTVDRTLSTRYTPRWGNLGACIKMLRKYYGKDPKSRDITLGDYDYGMRSEAEVPFRMVWDSPRKLDAKVPRLGFDQRGGRYSFVARPAYGSEGLGIEINIGGDWTDEHYRKELYWYVNEYLTMKQDELPLDFWVCNDKGAMQKVVVNEDGTLVLANISSPKSLPQYSSYDECMESLILTYKKHRVRPYQVGDRRAYIISRRGNYAEIGARPDRELRPVVPDENPSSPVVEIPVETKSAAVAPVPAPVKITPAPALGYYTKPRNVKDTTVNVMPPPKYPFAQRAVGKPGFVISPYDSGKIVDVSGFIRGTQIECPYTGKPFLVP